MLDVPSALRNGSGSALPIVVSLSGNIAVGKSTLGRLVAERLHAHWLPETVLSTQFAHLIKDTAPESRIIAEIAFAALRTATTLSLILEGHKRLVVERSLWEDWIFYELWRDQCGLVQHDSLMRSLFQVLESHPLAFRLCTVILNCDVKLLAPRAIKRNEPYDHLFTASFIEDLQRRYDKVTAIPRRDAITVDVTDLDISDPRSVESVITSIIDRLGLSIQSA